MEFTISEDCPRCGAGLSATVILPPDATHFYTACPGCVLAMNDVGVASFYQGTVMFDPQGRPQRRQRR